MEHYVCVCGWKVTDILEYFRLIDECGNGYIICPNCHLKVDLIGSLFERFLKRFEARKGGEKIE